MFHPTPSSTLIKLTFACHATMKTKKTVAPESLQNSGKVGTPKRGLTDETHYCISF